MTKFQMTAVLGGALAAATVAIATPGLAQADRGNAGIGSTASAGQSAPAPAPRTAGRRATPATATKSRVTAPNAAASTAGTWSAETEGAVPEIPALSDQQIQAFIDAIRTGRINSTSPVPGLDTPSASPTDPTSDPANLDMPDPFPSA